ncbi:fibronectin type III domain-containing protein [Sphingobacterium faecale]|uniref:Fibronectin type III domain-containing protein n=1 Tax=Sphingobacterium faecale TaxID=2803775 RepID=A0ABS1R6Z7_9SPHI|nr:fibronectin type III domain-containing protein [Sphingobacterium faecale]MBL1409631.1 fibronectin type III domain-containing protein [Sphingobacterium faecale]
MITPNYYCKTAAELLNYAEHIFQKMTESKNLFTNPVPSLIIFEGVLIGYRDAYAEAVHRDMRAVVIKGQKGKELQEVIYRLSHYVDAVAQGDPAIILAAGYRPSQPTTQSVGRTPQAQGLRVKNVGIGTCAVQVKVDPWKPARLYQYMYRKKGTVNWNSTLWGSSRIELEGLEMLKMYEFKVSYLGRDGVANFSDIITALVV